MCTYIDTYIQSFLQIRQTNINTDFLKFNANNSSTVQLNMEEFLLGNILDAIVSQVMILVRGKNLQLFHEIPDEIKTLALYGDQIKLQVVLSDFLLNVVSHTPSPNGWVEIKISPGVKIIQDGHEFIHLKFRYTTKNLFLSLYHL